MLLLGLDVGSTACKCAAYDEDGRLICSSAREYPIPAGASDIDAEMLRLSAEEAVAQAAAESKALSGESAGLISVTSFGESFVPTDKNGRALAPVIMYTGSEGEKAASRLISDPGAGYFVSRECLRPDATYSLPMLMSLAESGSAAAEADKFLLITDYICFCLTGECAIPWSLAARTMAFDVKKMEWDGYLLKKAGIDPSRLSRPVRDGSIVGKLLPSAAKRLGLSADTVVCAASHDQVSAALGCGVVSPGQAVTASGSVECLTPVFAGTSDDAAYYDSGYVCVPYSDSGNYVNYAYNLTGGRLLKWMRDELTPYRGDGSAYAMLDAEAEKRGVSDVLVIPHFFGAGVTPDRVPTAKGTISGITFGTTAADIYRAALEGAAFEMRVNIERMRSLGIGITALTATGGGARSLLWLQIKSDIFNVPVRSAASSDAGTLGAVMFGERATGLAGSLGQAVERCVRLGKEYLPDPAARDFYDEKYSRYAVARDGMMRLFER